jgi:protein-S-isoprenylcysteine O-methyltransferase Ste14
MSPKAKMWLSVAVFFVLIALALFVAAGTFDYWQAWVYLAVGAVSSVLITLWVVEDPLLLASRTKAGPGAEQRPLQKLIVACLGVAAISTFVFPGLDHRFGWSRVPGWLCIVGQLAVVTSMWMVWRVFKVNSFGSATVEVSQDQRVISTGPYAIVRHPMYASAAVYFTGLALALGSYWGLIASGLTILGFVWRLFDEEKLLREKLPGYVEYCARVRWRLIPRVF